MHYVFGLSVCLCVRRQMCVQSPGGDIPRPACRRLLVFSIVYSRHDGSCLAVFAHRLQLSAHHFLLAAGRKARAGKVESHVGTAGCELRTVAAPPSAGVQHYWHSLSLVPRYNVCTPAVTSLPLVELSGLRTRSLTN